MRVVSLLPSATEIVYALGCGDDLVGVTFECDFPPEARQKRVVSTSALPEGLSPAEIDKVVTQRIGAGEDLYKLDEGALADLDPDVILTQDLCAVCAVDVSRVDDALGHLGCTAEVVTLDPKYIWDIFTSIREVGTAIGAAERGDALAGELLSRFNEIRSAALTPDPPTVLVLEWIDPPFAAGHWVPDLVIASGGGRPVLSRPGADSPRVSWDDIAASGPDVVIVAPCGYHLDGAAVSARQLLAEGRFGPEVAVWAVDADAYVVRPGPRVVDGTELMASIFHPERFGAPDPLRAVQLQ